MRPVLYRYRDSESVIKPMEGYTPGEGWEPLYDQSAMDAAIAATRERCAKVCEALRDTISDPLVIGEAAHHAGHNALQSAADTIRVRCSAVR